MTTIKNSKEVPYTAEQMFQLVNSIDNYPQLLSWCTKATVVNRTPNKVTATLEGNRLGIHFAFTMIYQLQPSKMIEIYFANTGPFRNLKGFWRFDNLATKGSRFSFELNYELANIILSWTISPILKMESKNLINAFAEQAQNRF